jgi:hypothetical protein
VWRQQNSQCWYENPLIAQDCSMLSHAVDVCDVLCCAVPCWLCPQVWRQQNSQCWYENPLIAQDCSMLSPDCMDLLNKIFNLNTDERCEQQ